MNGKIVITTGLALFAMFFGAGNIVYPLALGAQAGDHIVWVMLAFLITGVGLPFLGLFSVSLHQGSYWSFFSWLGKAPSFLLIAFLILFLGLFFGTPRTETVTYHTLQPYLPAGLSNQYLFSALYCLTIFGLTYRQTKVVNIIGRFLSPIKLCSFAILIGVGLATTHTILTNNTTALGAFKNGFINGYGTMDLLAAFFFCSVVFNNLLLKAKAAGVTDKQVINKIFLRASLLGALLLAVVYLGFMLVAMAHAQALKGVDIAQTISAISTAVLGRWGALFVCICVSFACIATATALTEVTTNFFYEKVFHGKAPRTYCLLLCLAVIFIMSILGFAGIMKIALPILEVVYPALIIYSVVNMLMKLRELRRVDKPVYAHKTSANKTPFLLPEME